MSHTAQTEDAARKHSRKPRWWRATWFEWTAAILAIFIVALTIAAEYVLHHVGPIVRNRVVQTLTVRFHAPVQLDDLQISLLRGIEVEGSGLRVLTKTSQPLINVQHFRFRTSVEGLLHEPTHLTFVRVDGMQIHLPTRDDRGSLFDLTYPQHPGAKPRIAFTAEEILAANTTIVIPTSNAAKQPLTLTISRLDLHNIGPGEPLVYDAQLINPKPTGDIHAVGHFGPWNAADPRTTGIDGTYTFEHADLSTIKGIHGTLSSKGSYSGVLDRMTIDGTTDTADFSLDTSLHPEPLTTVFHAYVDATSGDTTLDPVRGRLQHSDIVARGTIENIRGQGHDIALDVTMPQARVEDVLQLAVKSSPPLLRGQLSLKMKLHIPPGKSRVMEKVQISGAMQIHNVVFQKVKWQDQIDGISMRAQGKPEDAKEAENDRVPEANAQMSLNFRTDHGVIFVDDLDYRMPGAEALMNGVYSSDGRVFDFKGHVRTQAKASQMVTGWKSLLLMPFDHMLQKNGAGLELPVSIDGTEGGIHFGLALDGTSNESSRQIAEGIKAKASLSTKRSTR
jgi:hypothetical protein